MEDLNDLDLENHNFFDFDPDGFPIDVPARRPFPRRALVWFGVTITAVLLVTAGPGLAADNSTVPTNACAGVQNAAATAEKQMKKRAWDDDNYYIPEVDQSFFQNCIGGILNSGASFNLGLPSIQGLVDSACNLAESQVSSRLAQLGQSFTLPSNLSAGGLINATGTISPTGGAGIQVNNTSSSAVINDIWKAIQ